METFRYSDTQWHDRVLSRDPAVFETLFDHFHPLLHELIAAGFGNYLRHDKSLCTEAVFRAIRFYVDHPLHYQPCRGSLLKYLELMCCRQMQALLDKENRPWHFQGLDHQLSRFLDNQQDVRLAKLILSGKYNWCRFAQILNVGDLRIDQQLSEISRNIRRIKKMLECLPVSLQLLRDKRRSSRRKSCTNEQQLAYRFPLLASGK